MLRDVRKSVSNHKNTYNYLHTIERTIQQMDELKAEYNMDPKYIVLGWKNYVELMSYVSRVAMKRPHVLREWMGCEIVVVKGIDLVKVVPDVVDLVGFRSS